jgi:hypothetical protein
MKLIILFTLLFASCGAEYNCKKETVEVITYHSCNWDNVCIVEYSDNTTGMVYKPYIGQKHEKFICEN